MKLYNFRAEPELLDRMHAAAKAAGLTVSEFIRLALDEAATRVLRRVRDDA